MSDKPEIVFTFPACMGGVASFNFNIINNSRLIKNFRSKVILLQADEDNRPVFSEQFIVDEVQTFNYSIRENKYHLLKRLNFLLGIQQGALVADNSLTIEAAALFNNPKTVYSLLHDYFYVNETVHLADLVDVAIAHSSFFSDAVFASNPALFFDRTFYIPYGVKQLDAFPAKDNPLVKLVFLGRLVAEKGVRQLFEINERLVKRNVKAEWTIIGKGPLKPFLQKQWAGRSNVSFVAPDSTHAVYEILKKQDILVFPTSFEGTPVSVLECLANGVVPVTNDLPGGIRDIVTENIGFKCRLNNLAEFAENICLLAADARRLNTMQHACFELAQQHFNIKNNADSYFRKFLEYGQYRRMNKSGTVKLSGLDKKYLPSKLVEWIRRMKN